MSDAPRILIADDDATVRSLIARVLLHAGYDVEQVADGREALARYRAAPADLVLLDIYMPGADGVEAIIRFTTEFPDVRVVAMSGGGFADAEDVLDRATRLGARGTLRKPVASDALLEVVRRALRSDAES